MRRWRSGVPELARMWLALSRPPPPASTSTPWEAWPCNRMGCRLQPGVRRLQPYRMHM